MNAETTIATTVAPSTVVAATSVAAHLNSRSERLASGNKLEAGLGTQSTVTSTLENASTEPRASASVPSVESPPGPTIIQLGNQVILPGQIGLANETRFNAAFFSEPLTEYASGWREPNDLEALLDFVAPGVQVGRRFEYKRADNAEAFLLDVDDYRAIGGDFKRVEYRGSSVNEKTLNRGLTTRVDLDAVGDAPDWREQFTTRLLQRLVRNELKRAVDLIVNGATNVAKTWDATVGKDPDQRDYIVSNEKIERTGYKPAFSLDDGIRELVKGFAMIRNSKYSNT